MSEHIQRISPALLAGLEQLKGTLETNGVVVRRTEPGRRASYRLRFRARAADGRRRQWSIALNDDQEAAAVKELIEGWKKQRRQQLEAVRQAQRARLQAERKKEQLRRRMILALAGGGRRRRHRIGRQYDRAVKQGIGAVVVFCMNQVYFRPNRRPGRRRKGQLALLG